MKKTWVWINSISWCGEALLWILAVMLVSVEGFSQSSTHSYLVKIKEGRVSTSVMRFRARGQIRRSFQNMNLHHLKFTSDVEEQSALRDLASDPDIQYVEPDYHLQAIGSESVSLSEVDSSRLVEQSMSGYSQSGLGTGMSLDSGWAAASSLSAQPKKPIVAVIDTGLDTGHPVFTGTHAVWVNSGEIANNGIDDDKNGYIDDVNGFNFNANSGNVLDDSKDGHGTHVSGIVLGASQNIRAGTLETARIQIMALKFLDSSGGGSSSDAINAIYYAVHNGATVINASWGGPDFSQSLVDAIAYAYNHGVIFVAAAGNYHTNNDSSPIFPSSFNVPSVISVAAVSDYDTLASFSDYGTQSVHIAAPGVYIASTIPQSLNLGNWGTLSGTSMAAPFVAGWAAMLSREAPNLTGYQLKQILTSNVDVVGNLSSYIANGRINANKSILAAKAHANDAAYQPTYSPTSAAGAAGVSASSSSASSSSPASKGCGSVAERSQLENESSSVNGFDFGLMVFALCLPIITAMWMYRRMQSLKSHQAFQQL